MLVSGLFTLCIWCVAVIGDKILDTAEKGLFKAISDSLTHGLIGVLSWAIVVVQSYYTRHYVYSKRFEIILCGILATLLDLDHFVSAKSWHLKDAVGLKKRPFLHCTTLWIGFYCIFITWAKMVNSGGLARLGTIVLTAGLSHHLRDGVRRGLWLFPFGHTPPLQRFLYLGALVVLPYFVVHLLPHPPPSYTPTIPTILNIPKRREGLGEGLTKNCQYNEFSAHPGGVSTLRRSWPGEASPEHYQQPWAITERLSREL